MEKIFKYKTMEILIEDDFWGTLKYLENAWCKRMDVPVLNSEGNLILAIQDDNKEGILDVQREAYKTYLQNEETYKGIVTDYLLEYYKWNYEYIAREVNGVDENDHKDVVTEKQLYQFMTLWYLFICRDGSFGYAFGCCWDVDNGLAVILSESEPRVISRTQLENLHKLNDRVLGLLVHDGKNAWKGLEVNSFFGKQDNLEIELEGGVDDGITVAQQKAYDKYLKNKNDYFRELSAIMLGVYMADEKKGWDIIEEGAEVTVSTALPKTLFVDRDGNFGWICYTAWDDSYIGALLSDDKLYLMSPDKLKNYSKEEKVNDEVIGMLFRSYVGFEGLVIARIAENVYTLPLVIESYDKTITEEMRGAYGTFVAMRGTLWDRMKDCLLDSYLKMYDEIEANFDIEEPLTKENVSRDNVLNVAEFTKLYISSDGRIAWLAECPTEPEDGIAFEFTTGDIELISQQDII